jgi:hypothetical protein
MPGDATCQWRSPAGAWKGWGRRACPGFMDTSGRRAPSATGRARPERPFGPPRSQGARARPRPAGRRRGRALPLSAAASRPPGAPAPDGALARGAARSAGLEARRAARAASRPPQASFASRGACRQAHSRNGASLRPAQRRLGAGPFRNRRAAGFREDTGLTRRRLRLGARGDGERPRRRGDLPVSRSSAACGKEPRRAVLRIPRPGALSSGSRVPALCPPGPAALRSWPLRLRSAPVGKAREPVVGRRDGRTRRLPSCPPGSLTAASRIR